MKSYQDWKLEEATDPDWDELRRVWGTGKKHADPTVVNLFKSRVERFKETMLEKFRADHGNPNIQTFRDLPLDVKDQIAQALVVAVLKSFYEIDGSGFDPRNRAAVSNSPYGQATTAQPSVPPAALGTPAPADWQG